MRGKVRKLFKICPRFRITPAYAGKSRRKGICRRKAWDHPRLCGEKNIFRQNEFGIIGSPPPMRGKAWQADSRNIGDRITPAYAGKSFLHPRRRRMRKDHPRLCGEKPTQSLKVPSSSGSPPPMRGKASGQSQRSALPGITPAYAGKSPPFRHSPPHRGDHPRLCGEKHNRMEKFLIQTGSPPPMRGKVLQCGICGRKVGITPAYAGKSLDQFMG